ncbi:ABC transporter permease [Lysinibacillus sp. NPDC093712]|uniref:ABC transporter permease n=1 Tax=Lysinibacillus sp. NPDC093712 TaxID=3390579 RepID=UPI003D05EDBC
MGKIWSIAKQQFKLILGKRGSIFLMFVMPLVFSLIFGFLNGTFGNKETTSLQMVVVDLDKTQISEDYKTLLKNDYSVSWIEKNESEAKKIKDKNEAIGVLIIPKGFQEGIIQSNESEQMILNSKQESMELQSVKKIIASSYQQLKAVYDIMYNDKQNDVVSNVSSVIKNVSSNNQTITKRQIIGDGLIVEKQKAVNRNSLGFAIMFLMFTLMSSSAVLLGERTEGTWGRLMTTPTSKITILMGYLLAFFMIGWFQFGIIMTISTFVFGVTWGNIWGVIIFASVLIVTFIGLGLMIGGFVKTVKQQQAIGSLIIISTSMLGGVYWPIDVVGDVLKKISYITPQSWALSGFQELMVGNSNLFGVASQMAILVGFAVVFLSLGLKRLKY